MKMVTILPYLTVFLTSNKEVQKYKVPGTGYYINTLLKVILFLGVGM
jgi:hypothetical protein